MAAWLNWTAVLASRFLGMMLAAAALVSAGERDASVERAIQVETTFAAVAERAFPAVVVISTKRFPRVAAPGGQRRHPFWERFPAEPAPGGRGDGSGENGRGGRRGVPEPYGHGSGVIIRADGYVLTNYHVIAGGDAFDVRLRDGRLFSSGSSTRGAAVAGVDRETDLAVLRLGDGSGAPFPTLRFADSGSIRVGAWALAVGAPYQLDYSLTVGHVSQLGRHDVGMTTFENYIQTDASINPGNSGGPLLTIRGEIMGINQFIITGTSAPDSLPFGPWGGAAPAAGGNVGLGFAIAGDLAQDVAASLIEHGEVVRPFLGIGMQSLTPALTAQFGVDGGVLVTEVIPGNPAETAGVQVGDVVIEVGATAVRTPHDLLFAVVGYEPGDRIDLLIHRGDEQLRIAVIATRRSEGLRQRR